MKTRFVIEPRYGTVPEGPFYHTQTWLVVYDKQNKKYVTDPKSKSKNKYMRFENSDKVLKYLEKEYGTEALYGN